MPAPRAKRRLVTGLIRTGNLVSSADTYSGQKERLTSLVKASVLKRDNVRHDHTPDNSQSTATHPGQRSGSKKLRPVHSKQRGRQELGQRVLSRLHCTSGRRAGGRGDLHAARETTEDGSDSEQTAGEKRGTSATNNVAQATAAPR